MSCVCVANLKKICAGTMTRHMTGIALPSRTRDRDTLQTRNHAYTFPEVLGEVMAQSSEETEGASKEAEGFSNDVQGAWGEEQVLLQQHYQNHHHQTSGQTTTLVLPPVSSSPRGCPPTFLNISLSSSPRLFENQQNDSDFVGDYITRHLDHMHVSRTFQQQSRKLRGGGKIRQGEEVGDEGGQDGDMQRTRAFEEYLEADVYLQPLEQELRGETLGGGGGEGQRDMKSEDNRARASSLTKLREIRENSLLSDSPSWESAASERDYSDDAKKVGEVLLDPDRMRPMVETVDKIRRSASLAQRSTAGRALLTDGATDREEHVDTGGMRHGQNEELLRLKMQQRKYYKRTGDGLVDGLDSLARWMDPILSPDSTLLVSTQSIIRPPVTDNMIVTAYRDTEPTWTSRPVKLYSYSPGDGGAMRMSDLRERGRGREHNTSLTGRVLLIGPAVSLAAYNTYRMVQVREACCMSLCELLPHGRERLEVVGMLPSHHMVLRGQESGIDAAGGGGGEGGAAGQAAKAPVLVLNVQVPRIIVVCVCVCVCVCGCVIERER
jgi:hypothetical protein